MINEVYGKPHKARREAIERARFVCLFPRGSLSLDRSYLSLDCYSFGVKEFDHLTYHWLF